MKKTITLILAVVLIFSFGLAGCAPKPAAPAEPAQPGEPAAPPAEKLTLKMSTTTADTSSWTIGAKKFAELVNERTNGRIEIKVYPNEQLAGGSQGKGIEMLMSGAIDFTYHSNIIYSIADERFGVISLPWLIPDIETADAKLSGPGGEAINKLLLEKGIVGLGFGENGFRQITNNVRPIVTPDDMKGLKIRIPGIKMFISLYKALGADPIAMNFGEVFTALQQKTIDGQENPTDVINSSKINEVQKYMTVWNYSYDAIILGMNKKLFDSLDKETQDIIVQAGKEACEFQRNLNRELSAKQTEDFIAKGMQVNELTPEQMKPFKEKVQSVYTEYEPIMGKELIDSFR